MPDAVQTVLGPVPRSELGIVLPHEHLFNDLSSVVAAPAYASSRLLVDRAVEPRLQYLLRQDPYCCADNLGPKSVEDVVGEVAALRERGGRTVVDATGSPAIGRDPEKLVAVARRTGVNIVMSTGTYLEKFEGSRITSRSVDEQTASLVADLTTGVGDAGVRAGVIGEVGVSPAFTPAERAALRAAGMAQRARPEVGVNVHMPGWERRGHEVLDILIDEVGVDAGRISLAHSDPSGADRDYQRSLLDRGVILEYDMVGLDIAFPREGVSPAPHASADAIARLIADGYEEQLTLSQDLFLKQMWTSNGGNGLSFVISIFTDLLRERGVDERAVRRMTVDNPAAWLCGPEVAA